MWFLPVSVLCSFISGLMVLHIVRTWDQPEKDGFKKFNEIMFPTLTMFFAISYPFLISMLGNNLEGVVFPTAIDELTLIGNLGIAGVMMGIFVWALSAKFRTIRNPQLLETDNNYEKFCEKFMKEYPERSKIKRRITHIIPGAVVGILIVLFYFLQFLLDGRWFNYALFFIIIVGVDFALTFALGDLIRLLDFSYMPPTAAGLFASGLTDEELDTFCSSAVMVFGFVPFLFFSFPIFFISLLITAVADAMAAIFGIMAANHEKKHEFPKGSSKSLEGYFGGIVFSFLCVLFGVWFSNIFGLSAWPFDITIMLGIILAITFFLIDITTTKIRLQDNYVNPLIMGLVSIVFLLSTNIAIF